MHVAHCNKAAKQLGSEAARFLEVDKALRQ